MNEPIDFTLGVYRIFLGNASRLCRLWRLCWPAHYAGSMSPMARHEPDHFNPQSPTFTAGPGQPLTMAGKEIACQKSPRGAFVYRLGHGPLKAERRVRFPYALPLIIKDLQSSAVKLP
jgi:hypothetical protein